MEPLTVYFAGSLFNLRELLGNVTLAKAIEQGSEGRYKCILPQDLEQRDTTPKSIRDQDIKAVLESDLILANYDGTELDSGTVVEYMIAKFADIPSVIGRSDFRNGGDQANGDPWNLMTSFFPNSRTVVFDGMGVYKKLGAEESINFCADEIICAFDWLRDESPPQIKGDYDYQYSIYNWINTMVGFEEPYTPREITNILERKRKKGLL